MRSPFGEHAHADEVKNRHGTLLAVAFERPLSPNITFCSTFRCGTGHRPEDEADPALRRPHEQAFAGISGDLAADGIWPLRVIEARDEPQQRRLAAA